MTQTWPPPGHNSWYTVKTQLDNGYQLEFDFTLPSSVPELELSTVRLGRHGGETGEDMAFRAWLYNRIGAITIAGGHAETAMKRLLALLTGDGHFSLVDETWTTLHRKLAGQCAGPTPDPRRQATAKVLAWGDQHRIKQRRDDVIHAYWWQFDGCGVVRSRFYRHQDGALMVGSREELEQDVALIFEYAQKLDGLLGEDWPRAMLPRTA
jgi:hypothetical protein